MNSFDEAYYLIKHLKNEQLHICSFWYPVDQTGIFPLCKLWVRSNNLLFYSDSEIMSSSCNTSLILNNFYGRLKSSFQIETSDFDFYFQIDEEENIANLELRLIINLSKDSYVSVFKVTLIRSFRNNPFEEFLGKVLEVCQLKDAKILTQQQEILKFSDFNDKLVRTQEQVKMMREETGVKLAAKFMVLMNQIKEKSLSQQTYQDDLIPDLDFIQTQSKKKPFNLKPHHK